MEFPARIADMLHNQRRKSKGENFFILRFLLQEMMQDFAARSTNTKTQRGLGILCFFVARFSQPSCG
jgi:hypothetical protein